MLTWKSVLLKQDEPLSEAISVLDRDETKIVLVVDRSNRLIGTITDGDIRRGLLKGLNLNTKITEVMNVDPKTVSVGEDQDAIKIRMKNLGIRQIPIVDKDGIVCGLETLKNLETPVRRDNPVFIMAGGFGTRLRPLTDTVPKPMLKIGGKPILERIIEGFVRGGFHEFYISTHYKAEMIREHFGQGDRWGVTITYIYEDEPLGTAGAISLLPQAITKLPIIMMNGDIITAVNFVNLLDFHEAHNGTVTVCVKDYELQVPYGVIEGNNHEVKNIVEKPIQRFFVNAGIYVLDPSLTERDFGGTYLDMPRLLQSLISGGERVSMVPIHEYWLDIGRMEEFQRAQDEADWLIEK